MGLNEGGSGSGDGHGMRVGRGHYSSLSVLDLWGAACTDWLREDWSVISLVNSVVMLTGGQ